MAVIACDSIALFSSSSPSPLPRVSVSPSSSFAVSSSRRSAALPQFSGLNKIQSHPGRSLLAPVSSRRTASISCQAGGVAVDIPTVSDAKWKSEVMNAEGPVLVEFYAPWCGPCRIIHSVIEELADEYAGKLKCFKLNTDDSPSIATQYGIRSVPTTLLFVNGEKKDLVLGAVPKSTLVASIEKIL